jgi:EAL domain-containing protein (putative c-di-GMP-specific phosphodiesterase class I)
VAQVLRETGLDPSLLILEITETVAVQDIPRTMATLRELKRLGVWLAMDDFGSGYSGLSYLQRSPFDVVKIDRSYVHGVGIDPADTAMLQAVMAFAKTLDLVVTAEGVENATQLTELRRLNVDHAQGYFFAPPQPLEQLIPLIRAGIGLAQPV